MKNKKSKNNEQPNSVAWDSSNKMRFSQKSMADLETWRKPTHYDYKGYPPTNEGRTLYNQFLVGNDVEVVPWNETIISETGGVHINQPDILSDDNQNLVIDYISINYLWFRWVAILMEQFEYQNLPVEITKQNIEAQLAQFGQIAFFKKDNWFYVQPFSVVSENIYNEPDEIIINSESSKLKDFSPREFVILKDTFDGQSLYNKIVPGIEAEISVRREMRHNLDSARPRGILVEDFGDDNPQRTPLADSLEIAVRKKLHYFGLKIRNNNKLASRLNIQQIKELFTSLDLRDRTEELTLNTVFWKEYQKEWIGLQAGNLNVKKDRTVNAEFMTETAYKYMFDHRIRMRREALDKINKLWNLDIRLNENEVEVGVESDKPSKKVSEVNDD